MFTNDQREKKSDMLRKPYGFLVITLLSLFGIAAVTGLTSTAQAEISVQIEKPTANKKVTLSEIITFKGSVHIPEHPEKEDEAIIVWQMKVGEVYVFATTKSGEEKTHTLDIDFPSKNSSFGPNTVTAIVNEFQIVGTGSYYGEGALEAIVLEEPGENLEGYIVNSTDPTEQDMIIGQNTEDLEGCTYLIEGYCIHALKGIPDSGLVFLQPWTNDSSDHWAYWIREAIRYANQNGYSASDKLMAMWYVSDRLGEYNEILSGVGYPEDGPTRDWETDITAPTTPIVTDDGDTTADNTQLHATWTSEDPESAIIEYQYCIGTTPGGINVVDWTSTGIVTEVTKTDLNLAHNQTHYFAVRARNEAGLWSDLGYSDGIVTITDITPPDAILTDYPTETVTGNTPKVGVTFTWTGSDPDGITPVENLVYQYKLEGHLDYQDWSDWSSETTKIYMLPSGNYTFKVRAKDEAGNYPEEDDPATAKSSFTVSIPTIVYPNPCYPNQGGQSVKITNLPLNSKVYIYTISGELIRTLDDAAEITTEGGSATATWDLRNDGGEMVARGIYIYYVPQATDKKTGNIAIMK